LSRRAGAAVLDFAGLARIEVREELQLAVADGDEEDPEPADRLGRPRVVHHAVLVRGEALDGHRDFHVGLTALHGEAEPAAEHRSVLAHVAARHTDVIEAPHGADGWRGEPEPLGEREANARRRVAREPARTTSVEPGRHPALRRDTRAPSPSNGSIEIVDAEREMVHAGPRLFVNQRMTGREDGEGATPEREDRHLAVRTRQLRAR